MRLSCPCIPGSQQCSERYGQTAEGKKIEENAHIIIIFSALFYTSSVSGKTFINKKKMS